MKKIFSLICDIKENEYLRKPIPSILFTGVMIYYLALFNRLHKKTTKIVVILRYQRVYKTNVQII